MKKIANKKSNISHKTNNELIEMALSESPSKINAVIQEAWRRQNAGLMYLVAKMPNVIINPTFFGIILKYILECPNESDKIDIFYALLSHQERIYDNLESKNSMILAVANSSPKLSAIALIAKGTPISVSYKIIDGNKLHNSINATFIDASFVGSNTTNQNKILEAIYLFLKEGYSLENEYAILLLSKARLQQNANDKFVAEIARFNMAPDVAKGISELANENKQYNHLLYKNFESNNGSGVRALKMSNNILSIEKNTAEIINSIIEFLSHANQTDIIHHILSILKYKCSQFKNVFESCLMHGYNNKNIFVEFAKQDGSICLDVLHFILAQIKGNQLPSSYVIRNVIVPVINIAINDFGHREILENIPASILDFVPLTQEERELLINKNKQTTNDGAFYPKLRHIATSNWYKYAKLVSNI